MADAAAKDIGTAIAVGGAAYIKTPSPAGAAITIGLSAGTISSAARLISDLARGLDDEVL